jgi:hypothetical protein
MKLHAVYAGKHCKSINGLACQYRITEYRLSIGHTQRYREGLG